MLTRRLAISIVLTLAPAVAGCGTTRWSDTSRTATEQMLMSDAIDRSISQIDFSILAGRDVFLDGKYIAGAVDEKYVMSTLRQHLFASGCIVKDKLEDAVYVVEVRAGALGTNRNDLLWGMPATNLPSGGMLPLAPTSIPELSIMKRTAQQGVCKVAVFAYDRASGQPIWQSGVRQQISKAKDVWVLGTGPFQHGTIYDGTKFAGERLQVPLASKDKASNRDNVWVAHEILFREPPAASRLPPARTASNPPGPNSTGQASPDSSAATGASATGPPATGASATGPPAAGSTAVGPPPSVVTTSTFGGANQSASGSPAGASDPQSSSMPNAATGAYGAVQAVDWARAVRQNYSTAK